MYPQSEQQSKPPACTDSNPFGSCFSSLRHLTLRCIFAPAPAPAPAPACTYRMSGLSPVAFAPFCPTPFFPLPNVYRSHHTMRCGFAMRCDSGTIRSLTVGPIRGSFSTSLTSACATAPPPWQTTAASSSSAARLSTRPLPRFTRSKTPSTGTRSEPLPRSSFEEKAALSLWSLLSDLVCTLHFGNNHNETTSLAFQDLA